MKKQVKEFFAITISKSLYQISFDDTENVIVEKISLKNSSTSEIETATKLQKGQFLGITKIGLITYDPENDGEYSFPQFVSTKDWRSRTSAISALFLKKMEALDAFISSDSFEMMDPQWHDATHQTLKAISHHSKFILPAEKELALPINF